MKQGKECILCTLIIVPYSADNDIWSISGSGPVCQIREQQ